MVGANAKVAGDFGSAAALGGASRVLDSRYNLRMILFEVLAAHTDRAAARARDADHSGPPS